MSDLLPICPSVVPLTNDQRRHAAINVCQFADYQRGTTEHYLLALGLIRMTPEGFAPGPDEDWFAGRKA